MTFHVVHRSQKDPLAADESAPQRVLVPAEVTQDSKNEKSCTVKEIKEQQRYGIFFDDDYNYLKKLKDLNISSTKWETVEVPNKAEKYCTTDKLKINLPSSVFESNIQEQIGLLNKAAPIAGPQLDLDPDIIAALDDDFDFHNPDNLLEDNFIQLAHVIDFEDCSGKY